MALNGLEKNSGQPVQTDELEGWLNDGEKGLLDKDQDSGSDSIFKDIRRSLGMMFKRSGLKAEMAQLKKDGLGITPEEVAAYGKEVDELLPSDDPERTKAISIGELAHGLADDAKAARKQGKKAVAHAAVVEYDLAENDAVGRQKSKADGTGFKLPKFKMPKLPSFKELPVIRGFFDPKAPALSRSSRTGLVLAAALALIVTMADKPKVTIDWEGNTGEASMNLDEEEMANLGDQGNGSFEIVENGNADGTEKDGNEEPTEASTRTVEDTIDQQDELDAAIAALGGGSEEAGEAADDAAPVEDEVIPSRSEQEELEEVMANVPKSYDRPSVWKRGHSQPNDMARLFIKTIDSLGFQFDGTNEDAQRTISLLSMADGGKPVYMEFPALMAGETFNKVGGIKLDVIKSARANGQKEINVDVPEAAQKRMAEIVLAWERGGMEVHKALPKPDINLRKAVKVDPMTQNRAADLDRAGGQQQVLEQNNGGSDLGGDGGGANAENLNPNDDNGATTVVVEAPADGEDKGTGPGNNAEEKTGGGLPAELQAEMEAARLKGPVDRVNRAYEIFREKGGDLTKLSPNIVGGGVMQDPDGELLGVNDNKNSTYIVIPSEEELQGADEETMRKYREMKKGNIKANPKGSKPEGRRMDAPTEVDYELAYRTIKRPEQGNDWWVAAQQQPMPRTMGDLNWKERLGMMRDSFRDRLTQLVG